MSSPRSEDFGDDLQAAKARDLKPLREESEELLECDNQTEAMEAFLSLAWLSGLRAGQARMSARVARSEPDDVRAIAVKHFEADFKELMQQSADEFNLSLPSTISMWSLLHQAWMAGNRTCEAELMGLYLEMKTDVAAEALEWLEEEN